ncbi:MAG: hypothetical protein V1729_04915 [Candidatus Woesearchaeota archaeon]
MASKKGTSKITKGTRFFQHYLFLLWPSLRVYLGAYRSVRHKHDSKKEKVVIIEE